MITIADIARDPKKALADLEESLGVEPGTLMREMAEMADGRLVENHTLSDTNAFPGRLRALPDLPSK